MNHVGAETYVDAPVDHVWAFLCDTSHWDDWDPRHKYFDWSGPFDEVGTGWVETETFMGSEWKRIETVVEVEPERLLHYRHDPGPLEVYFRAERCSPLRGGASVGGTVIVCW